MTPPCTLSRWAAAWAVFSSLNWKRICTDPHAVYPDGLLCPLCAPHRGSLTRAGQHSRGEVPKTQWSRWRRWHYGETMTFLMAGAIATRIAQACTALLL